MGRETESDNPHGDVPLIGRDLEFATAIEATTTAATLVVGPAGIGKTTLLRAIARSEHAHGQTVLTVTAREADWAAPGALIARLAEGAGGQLAPTLDPLLRGSSSITIADALISGLPERCTVIIDDLQWIDQTSHPVIARAVRSGRQRWVLASREPTWLPTSQEVTLEPLADPAIAAIVDRNLRHAGESSLTPQDLDRVLALAGGNPFNALELARSAALGSDRLPASLIASHGEWVGRIHTDALPVLLMAALDEDLPTATVASACGIGPDRLTSLLRSAVADGIVDVAERIRFRHPLHREAFSAMACGTSTALAHRRLAELTDGTRRLVHLARAGTSPDEELALALCREADERLAAGALSEALVWGQLARTRATSGSPGHRKATVLTALALLARDDASAAEKLSIELGKNDPDRHYLRFRIEVHRHFLGAMPSLAEATAHATEDERVIELALWASYLAGTALEHERSRTESARASLLADGGSDIGRQSAAVAAISELVSGVDIDLAALEAIASSFSPTRQPPPGIDPYFVTASAHLITGDMEGAWRWTQKIGQRAADIGELPYAGHALLPAVTVGRALGRLPQTWATIDRLSGLAHPSRRDLDDWLASLLSLTRRIADPDADPEQELARFSDTLGSPSGVGLGLMYTADAIVDGLIAHGRPDLAADLTAETVALMTARSTPDPGMVTGVALHAEALALMGDRLGACRLIDFLQGLPRLSARPHVLGPMRRASAVAELAGGNLVGARHHAESALDIANSHGLVFDLARSHLLLAQICRRARRRREARDHAEAARAQFAQQGQPVWEQQARDEHARVNPKPRSAPGLDVLSPSEERVAALAASGARNSEIARRLQLSEKTVEGNLSRIYRKIGVRNRTELTLARRTDNRAPEAEG